MAVVKQQNVYEWVQDKKREAHTQTEDRFSLMEKERILARRRCAQAEAMQDFRRKRYRLTPGGMCSYLEKVATSDWAEIMEEVNNSRLKPRIATLCFVEGLCRGRVRSYSEEERDEAHKLLQQIKAAINGGEAA